ncbi:Cytochrome c556 [Methylocapsa palsarum]|uniref:Cytochrome c556 n=2 Tax=Methylocapsa palsarum TaxID=1612308 RepID=A0A1I3W134_9HYPH|nr:Cytochrome c556 [Methylocapsa palsarum]
MKRTMIAARLMIVAGCAAPATVGAVWAADAQTPPPAAAAAPAPSGASAPGRAAVDVRKAAYTLVGANFKPLGNVLKGTAPYDAAEAQKNIARIAFLAELLNDAFPDVSNIGEPDSKAKAEIWSNRADFDKKLKQFQTDAIALVQVNATEQGAAEAFKAAVTALGQDCKACHDLYKAK